MSIFAGIMLFWVFGVSLLVVGLALVGAWRRKRFDMRQDRVLSPAANPEIRAASWARSRTH
jgi:cytochrome c-type biogenesis protein CcmH/NrfF